jgi:hypothetical protein
MVQDSGSSGDQQGASKMKELNLDLLFGPVKHVSTSIGTLHLYGLRVSDMIAFASLSGDDPVSRVRRFLPHIASLTEAKGFKDEKLCLSSCANMRHG